VTWAQNVPQTAFVQAYKVGGFEGVPERVRVQIPGGLTDLPADQALSLGAYLTEKAGEILAASVE